MSDLLEFLVILAVPCTILGYIRVLNVRTNREVDAELMSRQFDSGTSLLGHRPTRS